MPPRTRPAAVVFDLDGTLLDTMTLAPAAYVDTIRALGGPAVSASDIIAAWHLGPTPAVLAHFLDRVVTADDLEHFYHHFEAAVASARPFPGVSEMVEALGRAGYRLAIFTSATRRAAVRMLATAGLAAYFPTMICGDEVRRPKPAPDGLRLACRQLTVATGETAYVGDADVDLDCARAAGALAIHAGWGSHGTVGGRTAAFARVARHPFEVSGLLVGAAPGQPVEPDAARD